MKVKKKKKKKLGEYLKISEAFHGHFKLLVIMEGNVWYGTVPQWKVPKKLKVRHQRVNKESNTEEKQNKRSVLGLRLS